jgi:hypothetical protein
MDKRLNFILFQYFNTISGPPRWDSLTRRADSAARRVAKNRNFKLKISYIFSKNSILIKNIFFNSENFFSSKNRKNKNLK